MLTTRSILSIALALCTTSCSSTWTEAQRTKSAPAAVLPGSLAKNYYHAPQKISNEAAGKTGFITGFATGIIGGVVATSVVAGMQNSYEKNNAAQFTTLQKQVSSMSLGQELQSALTRELETIPHFYNRIQPSAPTRFTIEVIGLTFARLPGNSPDHALSCAVRLTCRTADGEELITKTFSSTGHQLKKSPVQAPVATYASNPTLLRNHFAILSADLARQCAEAVKVKLGME